MSVKKTKKIEGYIREHAEGLESKRDDLLKSAGEANEISKKIELYTAAEIHTATVRNLYTCIGQIQSEVTKQRKSAMDVVREYIAGLEKRRNSLLERANDNVHISKKIELYKEAKSVSRTYCSLHICIGRFADESATQENSDNPISELCPNG